MQEPVKESEIFHKKLAVSSSIREPLYTTVTYMKRAYVNPL